MSKKIVFEVALHFWCIWPCVWRRHGAPVACATSSAYSVALTSFLIRPRLALSTIAAHFAQWSKYKPLCWQLYNRMDLTIICMDGLYNIALWLNFLVLVSALSFPLCNENMNSIQGRKLYEEIQYLNFFNWKFSLCSWSIQFKYLYQAGKIKFRDER